MNTMALRSELEELGLSGIAGLSGGFDEDGDRTISFVAVRDDEDDTVYAADIPQDAAMVLIETILEWWQESGEDSFDIPADGEFFFLPDMVEAQFVALRHQAETAAFLLGKAYLDRIRSDLEMQGVSQIVGFALQVDGNEVLPLFVKMTRHGVEMQLSDTMDNHDFTYVIAAIVENLSTHPIAHPMFVVEAINMALERMEDDFWVQPTDEEIDDFVERHADIIDGINKDDDSGSTTNSSGDFTL